MVWKPPHPQGPITERQAVVNITFRLSSSTWSAKEPLYLIVTASLAESVQPSRPITILVDDCNILNTGEPPPDALISGAFKQFKCITSPSKSTSLALRNPNNGSQHGIDDLRERQSSRWLTIPATGEVEVVHEISLDRLLDPFPYEVAVGSEKRELEVEKKGLIGEIFQIGVVPFAFGTEWWSWGDLKGDLKDAKCGVAYKSGIETPLVQDLDPERYKGDDWIFSEDRYSLWFSYTGQDLEVKIVE